MEEKLPRSEPTDLKQPSEWRKSPLHLLKSFCRTPAYIDEDVEAEDRAKDFLKD
jgi:hypothetical protein